MLNSGKWLKQFNRWCFKEAETEKIEFDSAELAVAEAKSYIDYKKNVPF